MINCLEELKVTKVINKNDIEKIQKFINIKYKDEDNKNKAYMVSSTIHNIIESKMEPFPKSIQKNLKNTILKNTFLNNKDCIYLWDVFYSYINNVDFKKENIKILLNWINLNLKNKTDKKSLVDYLYKNNLLEIDKKNTKIEDTSNSKNSCTEIKNISNCKNSCTKLTNNKSSMPQRKNNCIYLQDKDLKFNNIKQSSTNIINKKCSSKSKRKYSQFSIAFITLTILFIASVSIYLLNINTTIKTNSKNIVVYENKPPATKKINILNINKNLPKYIQYKPLNNEKLKKYLHTRNSLLAEEPYFSSILESAKEFDINPLILFAITGQEQAFVPKNNKSSKKIANNPFNVFHSWKEYNSNIKDSSRIAGRTVFNLLKTMPKGEDPFKWVNNTYAEDTNWCKGVKSIFKELEKAVK